MIESRNDYVIESIAFSGFAYSLFSILLSDIHSISDILNTFPNRNSARIQHLFYISGFIANPVLIISSVIFGLGLIKASNVFQNNLLKYAGFASVLSCFGQIGLGIVDLKYAKTIGFPLNDSIALQLNSILGYRGLATLLIGISMGFISTSLLLAYFIKKENKYGIIGSIVLLTSLTIGILVKTLSLFYYPIILIIIFMVLMCIKSFGMVMMNIGILESKKWLTIASTG